MKDVEFVDITNRKRSSRKIAKAKEYYDVFLLPRKKRGESDLKYMYRVFQTNKSFIENRGLSGRAIATEGKRNWANFKEQVESRSANLDYDVKSAIKSHVMSSYMSGEEVARMNSIQALKNQGFYGMFREFSKEKGKYAKFDIRKLSYDMTKSLYAYKTDFGRVLFGWAPLKGTKSPMKFQMIKEVKGVEIVSFASDEPAIAKYNSRGV